MPTRRATLLGLAGAVASASPAIAESRPLVVMMSAEDCPPCHAWTKTILPKWQKTEQFARLDFKVIEGYRVASLDKPGTWARGKEYLPIYKAFLAEVPRWTANDMADIGFVNDHTAPRWFVVVDGKLDDVAVSFRRTYLRLDQILGIHSQIPS